MMFLISGRCVMDSKSSTASAGNDFFVHPLKRKNQGLRSGRPLLKVGKIINKDKYGYDVLDDYFSESDAEYTLELHRSSIELQGSVKEIEDDRIIQSQPTRVTRGSTSNRKCSSCKSIVSSVNSKVSTSTAGYNPVGWLHNKNYGRRTGKDIKAGKIIRKRPDGFEVIDDYWSESEADSLMLSKLSDSTRNESPTKNLQEGKSDDESETNTESGIMEYEDELNHNSCNSSSQNIEDICRNCEQSSLLSKTHSNSQNLDDTELHLSDDSRAVKRHSQRYSRGQSSLGSVLSEKNQTSFNKSINKKRGRLTKRAVQNTSTLDLTKSSRNSVDNVTSSQNDYLCDSNTSRGNSINEQSGQTHRKSMQNNVSQIQQTSQRKRSSEVTEDNLLDSDENQHESNNSSVSDRDPESEVLIDIERLGTDHDSESSGAKNEISPGKENCTPETSSKQQDTHSVLTQKSHTDKTEHGMQESVLEVEHKILTYEHEDDIDTKILPSNKSSKMSDPASDTVSLTRSTLTNITPYRSRTKTLSSNDQNKYSISFSEKNKENENVLSNISKENDKKLRSKTNNSSECDVENKKESNTLSSVTVSTKSFRLPSTFESPESIVMVEDEDIDDVTNKLLKPKTTRKSKGLSNSLKDDTLVSKSRKSDYSQVSIGVMDKSVSKTGSKSKHLSKVNNKNSRKSGNSDEEDMEKLSAETARKPMIERSIEHLVSQTTRKSTLEGNSEQSMSKTAGKSKRKDNVGRNLEVQETVERSDSEEEEAGEQMDVPNEPKIMSKPSRRSKRSSKVTTNRSVNYPIKSAVTKKLNKTTSEISQTHNQLHISVHKEEKPTSTRRSKMEKKGKKLITKKDKKDQKYSVRSKRNSGRGSQSQADDEDVVYTNNKGGNIVVTHADVHVSYEESEHSLSEEEITQFSSHQCKSQNRKTSNSTDKKSTYEKDQDNEEDVSDEEQTPTNTGDEDKEAEDVQNTVTKLQDIIGISKTHGISHLSQAASIVIGGNGTGSLTKLESDSVGTTPSFKTRKRLSYSIAAFDTSMSLEEEERQSDVQLSSQELSITDKQPLKPLKKTFAQEEDDFSLKPHKKTFALDSDSDASTNFLFLSQDVVQHPNTGGNIDTTVKILNNDINLNLSKSKDKKSKTRKSETVKEKEDQIEELSEKPVAKAAGEKEKPVSRAAGEKEKHVSRAAGEKEKHVSRAAGKKEKPVSRAAGKKEKPVSRAAGKKKRSRKKKKEESTSASPCHDQQVDKVQVKRNESKQITKNANVVNNSKTEINNTALNTDNVDSFAGSEQLLGDTGSVKLNRVQTEKVAKNMSFNNKGKKINRRKTTDNVSEEIEKTRGRKSNVAKYKKSRRSTPYIKLLEEGEGKYLTGRNLIQYEQKISKYRRSKNGKKSFAFDSADNSTIIEDVVYVEKADDVEELQKDERNHISQRENIEEEKVQIEEAFDIEEPQADLENQVSRREDTVYKVNVQIRTNGEADVEEKYSEMEELYHGDEEEIMAEDVSQEETTITKRLSFSGERKSKKKNSEKGKNKKRKNDSIKDVSPPKISKKNQERDTGSEDTSGTKRLSFSGEKKLKKKNSKKGKNKKRKNVSIKDVSPPKVSKKNQERDTEVVSTPAAMKMSNNIQTPDTESNSVPVKILYGEAFRSGISFRHKRRTIIVQEESEPNNQEPTSVPEDDNVPILTIQDEVDQDISDPHILHKDDEDIDGKIPNIIRRRSSIKYAPITDPISITPCIVKSKTNKRSKDRRVTISRKILETSYDAGNTSEMTDSPGQNTTDGPPVHIFEMTSSQTPDKIYNQRLNKIISPQPAPDGLRRSQRTRVQTLESYKLERPIYEKRKSGGFAIVGIKPSITEGKLKALELSRKNKLKSRDKTKNNRRLSGGRLSIHVELPSTVDTTLDTEITVHNPDSNEDVLLKCIGPKEEAIKFGPITGQESSNKDPFFMTRSLNQPGFGAGLLQIKGLMEKPMQITTKGSLIYQIIFGKMLVTIASSSFILSTNDSFLVPSGNRYCIKNLRKDNAKLHYVVLKHMESDEESD